MGVFESGGVGRGCELEENGHSRSESGDRLHQSASFDRSQARFSRRKVGDNREWDCSSGIGEERIEIPYQPPAEYDFKIGFTKLSGNNFIIQILSEKALPFIWLMSTGGDYTFHYVKGYGTGQNKTAVHGPGIAANARHISIVRVRKNGVEAFFDGRPLSKWRTDYADVSIEPFWLLRDNSLLGLATEDAKTVFHSVEVKEITDKGKFTR